uniref:Uncharacterized protein n=1 Tax=Globodera rostochiensis TaxID=31243 RepID=A0A914I007_GLORO
MSELGPGWLGGGAWGDGGEHGRKLEGAGPQAVLGKQRGGAEQMFGMGGAVELLDIVGTMVVQLEEK